MRGTYHLGDDGIYYPDFELPEEDTPWYGKYGTMRHTPLRKHRKAQDQPAWVDAMNNFQGAAEEIELSGCIYRS